MLSPIHVLSTITLSDQRVLSAEQFGRAIDACVAAQSSVLQVSPSSVALKLDAEIPGLSAEDLERITNEADAELFFRRVQFYTNR